MTKVNKIIDNLKNECYELTEEESYEIIELLDDFIDEFDLYLRSDKPYHD